VTEWVVNLLIFTDAALLRNWWQESGAKGMTVFTPTKLKYINHKNIHYNNNSSLMVK
jgi:hypothetical protein